MSTRRSIFKHAGLYQGESRRLLQIAWCADCTQGLTGHHAIECGTVFYLTFEKIDSAQIVLKPGVDEEAVQGNRKTSARGITVRKPESRSPLAEETSLSTQQGMRMARAFSLVVAVFIIANTFLINVTQRRKQLGIMRAIGATRRQIAGMVFREAMLMGVIGTILGSGLGVFAAHYLTSDGLAHQATLPIEFDSASVPDWNMARFRSVFVCLGAAFGAGRLLDWQFGSAAACLIRRAICLHWKRCAMYARKNSKARRRW